MKNDIAQKIIAIIVLVQYTTYLQQQQKTKLFCI